jgi:hypothetical protein
MQAAVVLVAASRPGLDPNLMGENRGQVQPIAGKTEKPVHRKIAS